MSGGGSMITSKSLATGDDDEEALKRMNVILKVWPIISKGSQKVDRVLVCIDSCAGCAHIKCMREAVLCPFSSKQVATVRCCGFLDFIGGPHRFLNASHRRTRAGPWRR